MGSFPVCITYLVLVTIQDELIQGGLKVAVHLFYVGSRFRIEVKLLKA
jgi:hypothetical protein